MIRGVDPSTEQFLLSLRTVNEKIDRAERNITSGVRVHTASDDPDQVSRLLQLRADLGLNSQIQANLNALKLEEDMAVESLQAVSTVLDRAKALSSTGMTGTLEPETRASLLQQVEALLQETVGLAGTTVNGRRIFSGDNDQVAPYTLDLTARDPLSAYAGGAATRQALHPNGSSFAISRTAEQIFNSDVPGESVLGALNGLRLGLMDDDPAAIESALGSLHTAADHLNGELVFYGTVQTRIQDAMDFAEARDVQLQEELAAIEKTDMAATIMELKDLDFQRSAALSARAALPRTSLFDYLG